MKTRQQKLDATNYQPASARMSRSTWLAVQERRQEFSKRDSFPYSFSAVMVFLLETYLHEQGHITAAPILKTHQLTLKELEDQIVAVRRQLAEILSREPQENL